MKNFNSCIWLLSYILQSGYARSTYLLQTGLGFHLYVCRINAAHVNERNYTSQTGGTVIQSSITKFVSIVGYIHIQIRADIKILDKHGTIQKTRQQQQSCSSSGPNKHAKHNSIHIQA